MTVHPPAPATSGQVDWEAPIQAWRNTTPWKYILNWITKGDKMPSGSYILPMILKTLRLVGTNWSAALVAVSTFHLTPTLLLFPWQWPLSVT